MCLRVKKWIWLKKTVMLATYRSISQITLRLVKRNRRKIVEKYSFRTFIDTEAVSVLSKKISSFAMSCSIPNFTCQEFKIDITFSMYIIAKQFNNKFILWQTLQTCCLLFKHQERFMEWSCLAIYFSCVHALIRYSLHFHFGKCLETAYILINQFLLSCVATDIKVATCAYLLEHRIACCAHHILHISLENGVVLIKRKHNCVVIEQKT